MRRVSTLTPFEIIYCFRTGCGQGRKLNLVAGADPNSQVSGYDLGYDLMEVAGFTGIEVKQRDGDPLHNFFLATKG